MKLVVNFFIIWAFVACGIILFQALTRTEKWKVTKVLAFSVGCAILTTVILTVLVILF